MVPRFRQGGECAGNWYDKSCILLFGDTGLGKSTILNLVTGHKVQTGDGVNGTTEENSIYNNFLHPERPKWMDTVGLNEARYNQDPFEVCQTYLRMLKDKDIESIHAIIWVIPVSEKNTTNIQQQAVYIQTLFENFGQTRTKDIWKNVIIVCRGTFNKNDFQGAHAAITDILKDNSKRARSMTCINMLPFEEISLSDLNLDCEAATKMRSDLEGALGSIESPLPLNFCDKVCVDCGQTDDPRLMDKECHLGQEIVEVPCCSSCLFAWCCCLNCTKQTIQCRNANCKTKDNKRSEWKKRKMFDVSKYNDVDYHNCAIVEMIGNRRIETPRNIPSHLRKEKHILKDPDSIKQTKCCF
jgi:GTPase SAR1 family protein